MMQVAFKEIRDSIAHLTDEELSELLAKANVELGVRIGKRFGSGKSNKHIKQLLREQFDRYLENPFFDK